MIFKLLHKYKNSQSVINIKNDDKFCFLWCIQAYLFPVEDNKTSKYAMYLPFLRTEGLEFPMKVKDIPKFENFNILNVNVFELTVSTPIHINTNYDQPQIPIAVGFYIISPYGNKYCSYFGESCVTWFVNEMLTLEIIANSYFETNLELEITPQEEESLQQSKVCWLCEQALRDIPLADGTEGALHKVRDNDHLTGMYRGAAHNRCNLNCKETSSSFVPIFFHNFSGYDCHIIFQELLTQAYKMVYEPKLIPKSMENYVSVQVGCLRFLDSYRFLSTNLDKLVKSINSFPKLDENGFTDELFKKNWLILTNTYHTTISKNHST